MIALIQRVNWASVTVADEVVARIDEGILALVAVEKCDAVPQAHKLIHKIVNYRIFADEAGRMNRSLLDIAGELLLVPQFTLIANTRKGHRPSFSDNAPVALGQALFQQCMIYAAETQLTVAAGIFGADMKVALENDGPVTFWLNV